MSNRSTLLRDRALIDHVRIDLQRVAQRVPPISGAAIRIGRAIAAINLADRELGLALQGEIDPVIEHTPRPRARQPEGAVA